MMPDQPLPPADATSPPTSPATEPAATPPGTRRRRRFLIWAAVLAVFAAVFWWALRGRSPRGARPGAAPAPVAIRTAAAARSDLPIYLDAIGTVTPIATNSITSQVTGRIVSVHYREGQRVQRGDPLIDIDPRPFAATLVQAEGTLERDLHVLAQAQMDRDRYRAAWARQAIARQQLDDQEKLVLQAEATVKVDRGVVDFDRIQLGYCRIPAPISGRVGLRLIDPGNLVTANVGPVLAVITQLQPISVVFPISEDHLGDVLAQPDRGAGLPVEALDRVQSRRLADGRLITIDNQIDTTTGTVRLRAQFDNADEALFPNQFVNTRLQVTTLRGATVVPSGAIQRTGDTAFVYVVTGGRAHVQRVTAGAVAGELTQVTGVAPGATVAISGFERLRDGAAVMIAGPRPGTP
ncbi:MAG TPA: efflux RND transporter periplasmic adaptor subunit [Kofleriaceae bacterium]|nr:efflux RND transporter periplasmic adaptor subunit [Kofleriaceae bacterium]